MKYHFDLTALEIIDEEMAIHLELNHSFVPFIIEEATNEVIRAENGSLLLCAQVLKGKRHGECRTYYPDHKLKSKCYYYEGQLYGPSDYYTHKGICISRHWFVKGKRHGRGYLYYETTELLAKECFLNDVYHGQQMYYYKNGDVRSELFYEKGKLQGRIRLFHPGGQIKRSTEYSDHLRHGEDRIFSPEGALLETTQFEEGRVVE